MQTSILATLLLALVPRVGAGTADRYASAIVAAAGDDNGLAVAMAVTAVREGQLRHDVERCRVVGPGGRGAWQLGRPGWGVNPCGPLPLQAVGAARALRAKGWGGALPTARVFGAYLGVDRKRPETHPEARRRARLWWWGTAAIDCACSPGWAP